MTKEELEHNHIKEIAENYVNECWGTYLDLDEVDLVMAGIGVGKIIAREQEKRIGDLENENAELKEKAGKYQMGMFNEIEKRDKQLTKAKELILKLYNAGRDVLMCRTEEKAYDNLSEVINDRNIEEFLNEEEKC